MTDETGPTWTCEWCGITHHAAVQYAAHVLVCAAAKRPSWRDDLDNLLATAGEAQWVEEIDGRLTAQLAELQQLRAERDEKDFDIGQISAERDALKQSHEACGNRCIELAARVNALEKVAHAPVTNVPDADDLERVLTELRARIAALEATIGKLGDAALAAGSALEARDRLIADLKHDYDQACKHLADALAARNEFMEERNAARKELSEVFGGPALTRAFRLERNSARFERDAALEVIAELVSGHLVNGEYCRHCGHGIMADDKHAEGCIIARAAALLAEQRVIDPRSMPAMQMGGK